MSGRWVSREAFRLFRGRQEDCEGGPFPRTAVNGNEPSALAHDSVDSGEAEAGTFAGGLGGEEGFENVGLGGRFDANAGIAHAEFDVFTGLDFELAVRLGISHRGVASLDGKLAAIGHSVSGVHR